MIILGISRGLWLVSCWQIYWKGTIGIDDLPPPCSSYVLPKLGSLLTFPVYHLQSYVAPQHQSSLISTHQVNPLHILWHC
jgi:hypothetical protein